MSNSIKVVARFRPQNKIEIAQGGEPIVQFESDETCKLDVSLWLLCVCVCADDNSTDLLHSPRRPLVRSHLIACLI